MTLEYKTNPNWGKDIDDLVEEWHFSEDDGISLQEFLHMNGDEYNEWAKTAKLPWWWTNR